LFYPLMRERPGGFAALAIGLQEQLQPPNTAVLRGRKPGIEDWAKALGREYLPDTMVLAIPDGCDGLPAVLDKPARPEPVNGWLCRGVVCLEPFTDLPKLKAACKEQT
ncbi:MAG TPA: hypothetical protein VIV54_04720, partial [Burkholderiales bacterium]